MERKTTGMDIIESRIDEYIEDNYKEESEHRAIDVDLVVMSASQMILWEMVDNGKTFDEAVEAYFHVEDGFGCIDTDVKFAMACCIKEW